MSELRPRPKPLHIDCGFAIEDACDIPGPAEPLEVPPGLFSPPPASPEAEPDEFLFSSVFGLFVRSRELMQVNVGDWPAEFEGVSLLKLSGRDEMGARYHGRLKVVCPMHGQSCHKFLFVKLLQNELGDHAVLYFLGVWLQKALDLDEHHHFRFQPGLPDMQAYKASLS